MKLDFEVDTACKWSQAISVLLIEFVMLLAANSFGARKPKKHFLQRTIFPIVVSPSPSSIRIGILGSGLSVLKLEIVSL